MVIKQAEGIMDSCFNFIALIEEYQKLKGIAHLNWEAGNSFSLSNEEFEINIGFDEQSQTILLVSYVGVINSSNKEDTYLRLLLENYANRSGSNAFWGFYSADEATLTIKKPAHHTDQHMFSQWIEQLCLDTQSARQLLSEIAESSVKTNHTDSSKTIALNQFITP